MLFLHIQGLFEEDPVVTVTRSNGVTDSGSLEQPMLVDATGVNESQSSISSIPVPQPSNTPVTAMSVEPLVNGTRAPYDPTELHLCEEFLDKTYGCKKVKGKPCSGLFTLDHYIDLRAQSSFLMHDELDLVLLGCIMCTVITDECIRDGRHKPVKRRRTSITFMHHAHELCKKTFGFLYGVRR